MVSLKRPGIGFMRKGTVMRFQMIASVGVSLLVPCLLAGLIGLYVGMSGYGDVSSSAQRLSHTARMTVPTAMVTGPKVQSAEGRFCRPVWSADVAGDPEEVCKTAPNEALLMRL
jgi:hypothetical protein